MCIVRSGERLEGEVGRDRRQPGEEDQGRPPGTRGQECRSRRTGSQAKYFRTFQGFTIIWFGDKATKLFISILEPNGILLFPKTEFYFFELNAVQDFSINAFMFLFWSKT